MSEAEELFELHLRVAKLLTYSRKYKFDPWRRWRFDFAFVKEKLAIEIDGGMWINGRHNRASGVIKGMEKQNVSEAAGWMVLHFTPEQVRDGSALAAVEKLLPGRERK